MCPVFRCHPRAPPDVSSLNLAAMQRRVMLALFWQIRNLRLGKIDLKGSVFPWVSVQQSWNAAGWRQSLWSLPWGISTRTLVAPASHTWPQRLGHGVTFQLQCPQHCLGTKSQEGGGLTKEWKSTTSQALGVDSESFIYDPSTRAYPGKIKWGFEVVNHRQAWRGSCAQEQGGPLLLL